MPFVRTSGLGFLRDARRLNVALTRAQRCLVLVGNVPALKVEDSAVRDLVRDAERRGVVRLLDDVVSPALVEQAGARVVEADQALGSLRGSHVEGSPQMEVVRGKLLDMLVAAGRLGMNGADIPRKCVPLAARTMASLPFPCTPGLPLVSLSCSALASLHAAVLGTGTPSDTAPPLRSTWAKRRSCRRCWRDW